MFRGGPAKSGVVRPVVGMKVGTGLRSVRRRPPSDWAFRRYRGTRPLDWDDASREIWTGRIGSLGSPATGASRSRIGGVEISTRLWFALGKGHCWAHSDAHGLEQTGLRTAVSRLTLP